MVVVKQQDFTLFHDITDGVAVGWTVGFALHYTARRGTTVRVWARSPTGRMVRNPQQVSRIMPVEDWPEFARKTLTQSGEGNNTERLF